MHSTQSKAWRRPTGGGQKDQPLAGLHWPVRWRADFRAATQTPARELKSDNLRPLIYEMLVRYLEQQPSKGLSLLVARHPSPSGEFDSRV